MDKRSPWAYVIAALSCAMIIALCVLLPRCLSRNHQSALLGTTEVEPLEAMPVEAAPTPLPEEALVDRAIEWYARQNQSAQFVNLQEDVEPSNAELDTAAALEKLQQQMLRLTLTGIKAMEQTPQICYYRLAHGVTEEYQGFYRIEYEDETANRVKFILDANTGTILNCEFAILDLDAQGIARGFAGLWRIEDGRITKWQPFASHDREYLLYGNGTNRHISIVVDGKDDGLKARICTVTLRPGTGENQ